MEEKSQISNRRKPLQKSELDSAETLSCSPDHSITRSTEHPIISPLNHTVCAPDHPFDRVPDSEGCRECLTALAHRLAQPMTALRGGMELGLMGNRSAADYRSVLEQSIQLADSMAQLIVSLRDLGESSAPGGAPQSVLLEATATEVLPEMEGLAQSRGLHLQLHSTGKARVCANPERLREAFQILLAWTIQNSAGGGVIALELSTSEGEARVFISPPRLDLQYLQIKVLEDITTPGMLFSHASKSGAMGWAINQRLWGGLGGRLETLTEGRDAGCIRVSFPLAPAS